MALITISITNFSCSANEELDAVKKTDKQSAKIEFRYTQNEHIRHDKGKGKYFTLDVFGEFLNGKAVFDHENYNTDLLTVKNILGHSSLSTTEVDTHIAVRKISEDYQEFNPAVKNPNLYIPFNHPCAKGTDIVQ